MLKNAFVTESFIQESVSHFGLNHSAHTVKKAEKKAWWLAKTSQPL